MNDKQRKFLSDNPDPIVYQLHYNERHKFQYAPREVREQVALDTYKVLSYDEAVEVTISEVTVPALRETAGADHRVMEPWEIIDAVLGSNEY